MPSPSSTTALQTPPRTVDESPEASARGRGWIFALAMLTLAGGAAGFTLIASYDTFWHLAAGEWMLRARRVLGHDPFSSNPVPVWINVHWLFQVIAAALFRIGGWSALTVLKAALTAGAMAALVLSLRRRVGAGWLLVSGLAMLYVIFPRLRARPEMFTLLFLTVTVLLVDGVRRGRPARRLWWLGPILLVWVNMHGLYILGLAVIWLAVGGALLDKLFLRARLTGNLLSARAIVPMLAATVACLLTPWPVRVAVQPLLLWTRISGEAAFYTWGVSELKPTWEVLGDYTGELLIAAAVVAAMIANFRRLPLSHVLWLVAFGILAVMAQRNVGLAGPLLGVLLALHGGDVIVALRRRFGGLGRLARPLTVAALLAGVATIAAAATEWGFRAAGTDRQFGAGLQTEKFPVQGAAFLAALDADGDILCENFGDAAPFIFYASDGRNEPARRVFMDGRLEVHSEQRFVRQHRIRMALGSRRSARRIDLPGEVRFIVVGSDARMTLSTLMSVDRYALLYLDPAAAVFVRRDWPGRRGSPLRVDPPANLAEHDRPLVNPGWVEGLPPRNRRWWDANAHSLSYQLGGLMLHLGSVDTSEPPPPGDLSLRLRLLAMSTRYLTAAGRENIAPGDYVRGMLAQAHQQTAYQSDVGQAVPVDVHSARALHLYRQMDLSDLSDPAARLFALQRLVAMKQARQLDAALEATERILGALPVRMQVNPPAEYRRLREAFEERLKLAESALASRDLSSLLPAERARVLVTPQYGLIDRAIAELRLAPMTTENRLLLGDLLLSQGKVAEAREAYDAIAEPDNWRVELRRALCDWVAGAPLAAAERLDALTRQRGEAVVGYYAGALGEQIGRYDRARAALKGVEADDARLAELIDHLWARLDRGW